MKGKGDLPIHCWTDTLDATTYVACARCYVYKRGMIYGLSCFVMIDVAKIPRWHRGAWQRMAEDRLLELVRTKHYGSLPPVCDARLGREWGFA